MQQTWSYTQTLLAHIDVVHTFKGSGFTTTGNHISSFQNMCLSNDKKSSQLLLQPSLGATLGGKSMSDSTVTTSWLSAHGKGNLASILVSCPCCTHFFSQQLKITLPLSLKTLPGKTNKIIRFFHLTPQTQRLPTPTQGILRELWMLNCKISCL